MRQFWVRRLFLCGVLLILLGACGGFKGKNRITSPPSLSPSEVSGGEGIFNLQGIYVGSQIKLSSFFCKEESRSDPNELIPNPLNPSPAGEETALKVTDEDREKLKQFISLLQWRVAGGGSVATSIPSDIDSSQTLPWIGKATTSERARADFQSLSTQIGERQFEGSIEEKTFSINWTEATGSPVWIGEAHENKSRCSASGGWNLTKVGELPPIVSIPPNGAVQVLKVFGSSDVDGFVSNLTGLHWFQGEDDATSIGWRDTNNKAVATGSAVFSGGVFVLELDGSINGVTFVLRGAKTEQAKVEGKLITSGGIVSVELAG